MNDFSERALISHIATVLKDFQSRFIDDDRLVNKDLSVCIKINNCILMEVLKHASVDLNRMIKLHLPDADAKPNRFKYAGFLAKWIAKMRPIYIENEYRIQLPHEFMINAFFALWVFRSFIGSVPREFYLDLVYALHFRDDRGETLSVLARTLTHNITPKP